MVAIVAGNGLGLEQTSGFILGARGQIGSSSFGRFGEQATVNAATGNLVLGRTDEILIGQGPDSAISRSYNSLATASGLGTNDNWRLNAQRQVTGLTGTVNTAGSTITRVDWDGSSAVYTYSSGTYISKNASGAYDTLTFASNVWTWTDGNARTVETYDSLNSGRITTSKDIDNNALTYTYTGSNLTRVTTQDGEHTDLTWSGSNLTQIVTTLSGGATLTRTRYTYDGSNRLATVTTDLTPGDNSIADGATVVTTYGYDSTSSRVASITQTGGASLAITYVLVGSTYRVASLTQTMATGVTNVTSFSYDTTNRITTVTDGLSQVTKFTYDTNNQLTQIELPAAQSGIADQISTFAYNANGDVTSMTDASGHVTTYTYDANGNITLVRDAVGNTITRTYDSANHILTETRYFTPDPDGAGAGTASVPTTTRYVYDTAGNLQFVVSPLGEVTQYVVNAAGQVTSVIAYRGSIYNVTGLATTASIALSSMTSWVSGISDKSNTQRVDTTYDFRGNVATTTSYSQVNTSGAGITTATYTRLTYTYDQYGNLLTRQTSGITNTETFVYDGLGRLVSSTDLNGATTTVAFTDSLNKAIATMANGLVQTTIYNAAGDVISSAKSGSGITTGTVNYAYDKLGQLRMVTDATGNKTYYLIDAVGRKIADIAADGSITEYRYDASDRLVSTTSYATRLTSTQINSLVSSGAPANVALSTVRPTANAADVWTWRIYDNADRLIEAIDGTGGAIVYAYDGLSNLISTTAYANKIAAATVTGYKTTAPTTAQLPTADSAHDGITRAFYDTDGRLLGKLDADGYLTQTVYDSAGEIVETIAFANVVASSTDRASGTFAVLLADVSTSSADEHTRYFYDAEGNLKYKLDRALQPTEYVYDAAGHVLHAIVYGGAIASTATYTAAYVAGQITSLNLATNANTRTSYSVYDNAGRVAFSINAEGDVVGFSYDAVGQVIKTVAYATVRTTTSDPTLATMTSWVTSNSVAADRVTRAIYDQAGRLVYTVDGEGYVTENRYDLASRITLTIRYPSSYTVTDSVTLASMASALPGTIPTTAVQISYVYDVDGRLTDSYDGVGVQTHIVYDAAGRISDKTVAYGTSAAVTTHFNYDLAGRVLSEVDANGTSAQSTTTYTYDGRGNVLTKMDGRGVTTTYSYDNLAQVKTAATSLATITYYYDAFGNVNRVTDGRGNNSYSFYDSLDRLTYQIDGEGYVTKTTYTIGSEIASVTHYTQKVTAAITAGVLPTITATPASDETTTFTRDKLGRVTRVTDAEGNYENYTLSAFGERTLVRNKLGGNTTNTFDHRGLLLSEIKAETSTLASPTSITGTVQATSVTNTYQYDARGNLTKMVEASGLAEQRTTNYVYDKANRVTQTTGDAVNVIADDLKTVSSVTPTTSYTYDSRGNLIESDDAAGARTLYYYDALNRRIASVNAAGALATFTYDGNGNVLSQRVYETLITLPSSPGGTVPTGTGNYRETTYTYDAANRVATTTIANATYGSYGANFVTGTGNLVITNTYDAAGNLISQQDANGGMVYYYYDKRGGKIAQVDQNKFLTLYTLDDDGNVTKEQRIAAFVTGTVVTGTIPTYTANSAADRVTDFTYDRNGRRLTEQREGVVYTTITSGGVKNADVTATSIITYTYNGLGQVTSKTEATGDTTTNTYDTFGRQTNVATPGFTNPSGGTISPSIAMYYDGLNNLTATASTTASLSKNTYGAGGRLTKSTDADGFDTNYEYDAMGRVKKQSYTRTRTLSTGNATVNEAKATRYDVMGRTVYEGVAVQNGSNWDAGDYSQKQYNAFGEISQSGMNGLWQESYSYDNAGRIWRSTKGDGIVKLYYYDKNGNQTLQATSDGNALPAGYSWSTMTLANLNTLVTSGGVFGAAAVAGVVLTYKTYDARGQNLAEIQPHRQLSASLADVLITKSRTYNAFGEVTQDTDANINVTSYAYNMLGRLVQTTSAAVNMKSETGTLTTSFTPVQKNYYDLSGRLVAVEDANNNVTRRTLLAGTGYGKTDASVVKEYGADNISVKINDYDQYGNVVRASDGTNVTTMTYDLMGRLMTVTHPQRGAATPGNSGAAVSLVDTYIYDELGQRNAHYNSFYGSGTKDFTDYDVEGRVVSSTDMENHVTTDNFTWSSTVNTALAGGGSLGTFGGWVETTTNTAGLTSTLTVDAFNRVVGKTDFGAVVSTDTYDLAGRLATQSSNPSATLADTIAYKYYNTGQLRSVEDIEVQYYTYTDAPSFVGATDVHIGVVYHPDVYGFNESCPYDNTVILITPAYDEIISYDTNYSYSITLHDSNNNPVVEYLSGWTAHNYSVATYAATKHDTITTTDLLTDFEYDKNGNRTHEHAARTIQQTLGTATVTGTAAYTQNWQFTSDTGQKLPTTGPQTGVYYTQDPPTYYVYYYNAWVEAYGHYYDFCYGEDVEYDLGYGSYQTIEVDQLNPTTYTAHYYTYYSSTPYSVNNVTYYVSPMTGTYSESTGAMTYGSPTFTENNRVLENEAIQYDAENRVKQIDDTGVDGAAPITINTYYDKVGNVRERITSYRPLDGTGTPQAAATEDDWYKYDAMNRFVLTKGTLTGGAIVNGTNGVTITYDAVGNRATSFKGAGTQIEKYIYTADGFLARTDVSVNSGTSWSTVADYDLDAMGRSLTYHEYNSGGMAFTRTATYNKISQVVSDKTDTVSGGVTYTAEASYTYDTVAGTAPGLIAGKYMGGVLVSSHTKNTNSSSSLFSYTDVANTYNWRDSTKINTSSYTNTSSNYGQYYDWCLGEYITTGSNATTVSNYTYDGFGNLKKVDINDNQPRKITYVNNAMGEVLTRDVSYNATPTGAAPHERHYYLGGTAIGDVTNNGTSNTDYVTQIAARTAAGGTGPFRGGASTPTSYSNFDQSYDPINGYDSTTTTSTYVIKQGDTLQSIASQVWGDANLWYLIANANGLQAGQTLPAGMTITIPSNQVHNFHNSSSTFKVYDPNLAIGDTSPTAPEIPPPPPPPAPAPAHHHGGCGIFGQILVAVIAIAVAIAAPYVVPEIFGTEGILGGGIVAGVAAGAVGGIVSQGFAVATGIQSSFNWGAVAMSAIGGGVAAGVGQLGISTVAESATLGAVARGVIGNVVSQGIDVAVGLQKSFDWTGVVAAGIGAGVGAFVSDQVKGSFDLGSSNLNVGAERLVSGMAGNIANAATRSLINGSDFGDNIIAALPDTIGQTIGGYMADRVREGRVAIDLLDVNHELSPDVAKAGADAIITGNDGSLRALQSDGDINFDGSFKTSNRVLTQKELISLFGSGDKPNVNEAATPAGPTRPLTPGEKKLLSDIFGTSLDSNRLRIGWASKLPDAPENATGATYPHIFDDMLPQGGISSDLHELFLPEVYRNDFSAIGSAQDFRAAFDFVHESAHAWQMFGDGLPKFTSRQTEFNNKYGAGNTEGYMLQGTASIPWRALTIEQQPQLVAFDWAMSYGPKNGLSLTSGLSKSLAGSYSGQASPDYSLREIQAKVPLPILK